MRFDIPAQALDSALPAFIEQSKTSVMFNRDEVKAVRANEVVGTWEPAEALGRLLKGTGYTATAKGAKKYLVAREATKTADTGRITGSLITALQGRAISGATVRVVGEDNTATTDGAGFFTLTHVPAGTHLLHISSDSIVPAKITDVRVRAGETTRLDALEVPLPGRDGSLEMSELTVNASELGRNLTHMEAVEVTGSRIRSLIGEQGFQPMITLDRQQIDRTGVTTFGDLFRYIPQVTSFSNGRPSNSGSGQYSMLDSSTSLTATLRGFDSSSTLILVDGRRANKNNQSNTSPRYDLMGLPLASVERVEVLLDGASAVYGADAVGGVINIITRKNYSGTELRFSYDNMFTTDAARRSVALTHGFAKGRWSGLISLTYEDNTSLSNQDTWYNPSADRRPFGGTDGRSSTLTEGTGYVRTTNGANLPGLSSSRAAIPTGSDGRNVTIADYANAGPIGDRFDSTSYFFEPITQECGGSIRLEYRYRPWLSAYVEGRGTKALIRGMTDQRFYYINSVTLPVGYPGNPFGVPIVGVKVFFDQEPVVRLYRNNVSFVGGIRGDLPRGWRYDSSIGVQRSDATQDQPYTDLNSDAMDDAVNGPNPPVLLYDSLHVKSPNPPNTFDNYSDIGIASRRELPVTWTYDFNADGPIWTLPAGDVRVAFGAEGREEYVDFPIIRNAPGLPAEFPGIKRSTLGLFAETRIPVLSPKQELRSSIVSIYPWPSGATAIRTKTPPRIRASVCSFSR